MVTLCRITGKGARMFSTGADKQPATASGSLGMMGNAGHIALAVTDFPGAPKFLRERYGCFAVSQLNYILGDTGTSFVVGEGSVSPRRALSRDAFCGLLQLKEECTSLRFNSDFAPNANV
jgi:hypothetical protein